MTEGTIFDLKRFAVHDGSGLRTTLFLKGCPLRCPWCQNPEGLTMEPVVLARNGECLLCGSCEGACPRRAISIPATGRKAAKRVRLDRDKCVACGKCAQACPTGSIEVVGSRMDALSAARLLLRDRPFFGDKGGVTLSGGEVLLQWEFARQVLSICRSEGIRTAVETSMHGPREALEALLGVVDEFLVDIKYADSDEHLQAIGVPNTRILSNYQFLAESGADIIVRTPLIPGYTDTEENIRAIARIVCETQPEDGAYELLAFNPLCRSKYEALGQQYDVPGGVTDKAEIARFRQILQEEGVPRIIEE